MIYGAVLCFRSSRKKFTSLSDDKMQLTHRRSLHIRQWKRRITFDSQPHRSFFFLTTSRNKTEKYESETEESRFAVTQYRHFKQSLIWCVFKVTDKVGKKSKCKKQGRESNRFFGGLVRVALEKKKRKRFASCLGPRNGSGRSKASGLFYRNQTLAKDLLDSLTHVLRSRAVEGNGAFDV